MLNKKKKKKDISSAYFQFLFIDMYRYVYTCGKDAAILL